MQGISGVYTFWKQQSYARTYEQAMLRGVLSYAFIKAIHIKLVPLFVQQSFPALSIAHSLFLGSSHYLVIKGLDVLAERDDLVAEGGYLRILIIALKSLTSSIIAWRLMSAVGSSISVGATLLITSLAPLTTYGILRLALKVVTALYWFLRKIASPSRAVNYEPKGGVS